MEVGFYVPCRAHHIPFIKEEVVSATSRHSKTRQLLVTILTACTGFEELQAPKDDL
jgi:hypothetical protein